MRGDERLRVTDAAVNALEAPRDSVRVIITEMPATDCGIAGKSFKQRRAEATIKP